MEKDYVLFLDADGTIFKGNSWEAMLQVVGFKRDGKYHQKFKNTPSEKLEDLFINWTKHDVYQIYSRIKEGDTKKAKNLLEMKEGFLEFIKKYRENFSEIIIVSSGMDLILKEFAKEWGVEYEGIRYNLLTNPPRSEKDVQVNRVMVSENKKKVMDKYSDKNRIYIADDPAKNYEGNHNGVFRIYMDGEKHQNPSVKDFHGVSRIMDVVLSNDFENIIKNPSEYFPSQEV